MSVISRIRSLWRNLARRPAADRDLDDEVLAFVELRAAEHVRGGMAPDVARRAALLDVGGVEQVREEVRAVRAGALVDTLLRDLRHALRLLARDPGFTAAAVVALALGIGANTAILSVVNGVLLRPLAYRDPEHLVVVLHHGTDPVAPANYADWKASSRSFAAMGAADYWTANLTGGDQPEKVFALKLTADVLPLLGVAPALGHLWSADDDAIGRDHQVVISHRLWQRRFGGDRAILDHPVQLDGEAYTVIAVMPAGFAFAPFWATKAELWAPLALAQRATSRSVNSLRIFARLKPDVTVEQARADLAGITARLEQQFPGTNRDVQVVGLTQRVVGDVRTPLLVLMGAVAFVLLIACANVAHMLLARASVRGREIALRAALGASRTRIVRQLLTESVLLALAGGAAGVLLAFLGVRMLIALGASSIPRVVDVTIDGRVLWFALLLSVVTGIAFGVVPALQGSVTDLSDSLKEGQRGSTEGARRNRARTLLVASEFALALVLLVGAGLMIRSFAALQSLDPGFDPQGVLTTVVSVTGSAESAVGRRAGFYDDVIARVRALPGVTSVSAINHLPLAGDIWGWSYAVEGASPPATGSSPTAAYRVVVPGYFATMGIPILAGRDIAGSDRADAPGVVVINEYMAKLRWPNENPIGKRITLDNVAKNPAWLTVIGVAKNDMRDEWNARADEEIFLPFAQNANYAGNPSSHFSYMTLVVRATCAGSDSGCDAARLIPAVRNAVAAIDPNVPLSEVQTMEQVVTDATAVPRFYLVLLAVFAAVALALAAVGIYGVMSYSVSRRTHEIGLRVALGASPRAVLGQVVREGMSVVAMGGVAGALGAFALTRLMSGFLFGVSASDPATFVATALVLGGVAFVATYIPARRAATIDPLVALRAE